ncbi:MAG: cytochrome c oxidase subunit II [Myxococcota bacterium]
MNRIRRIIHAVTGAIGLAVVLGSCGNPDGTIQMPKQSSTLAADVDALYYFIFWISVVSFVLIIGFMLYFSYKYRRRPGHKAVPTGHHTLLEIFWTFSPLILLAVMFHWGFEGYVKGVVAPSNAVEVGLYGSQWKWTYEHSNGGTDNYNLVVPVGTPVELIMSSEDVIHSYFVPDFRVKRDVVPGMYTTLWFEAPDRTYPQEVGEDPAASLESCDLSAPDACPQGTSCRRNLDPSLGENTIRGTFCYPAHQVFCTEYCGAPEGAEGNAGHSAMNGAVHVVTQAEYEVYLASLLGIPDECKGTEDETEQQECWGELLYASNQCNACHSVNGATIAGPTFAGLWGRVERMQSGAEVEVMGEEGIEYLRESIMQPQAQLVAQHPDGTPIAAQMPANPRTLGQVDAIIAYIQSLADAGEEG